MPNDCGEYLAATISENAERRRELAAQKAAEAAELAGSKPSMKQMNMKITTARAAYDAAATEAEAAVAKYKAAKTAVARADAACADARRRLAAATAAYYAADGK